MLTKHMNLYYYFIVNCVKYQVTIAFFPRSHVIINKNKFLDSFCLQINTKRISHFDGRWRTIGIEISRRIWRRNAFPMRFQLWPWIVNTWYDDAVTIGTRQCEWSDIRSFHSFTLNTSFVFVFRIRQVRIFPSNRFKIVVKVTHSDRRIFRRVTFHQIVSFPQFAYNSITKARMSHKRIFTRLIQNDLFLQIKMLLIRHGTLWTKNFKFALEAFQMKLWIIPNIQKTLKTFYNFNRINCHVFECRIQDATATRIRWNNWNNFKRDIISRHFITFEKFICTNLMCMQRMARALFCSFKAVPCKSDRCMLGAQRKVKGAFSQRRVLFLFARFSSVFPFVQLFMFELWLGSHCRPLSLPAFVTSGDISGRTSTNRSES